MTACGPSVHVGGDGAPGGDGAVHDGPTGGGDGAPVIDSGGSTIDVVNPYGDADLTFPDGGCTSTACPSPVPDGCGATEMCGNGLDDNCDGQVDEGCSCSPGAVQPCFRGPPGRRNVGSCVDGSQTCVGAGEFGQWGTCMGGISPTTESCDSQDNNCDGCIDNNPTCCVIDLHCPGPGDMPDGTPFTDYVINGATFYTGAVSSWLWTVQGGPCDQLLYSTSGTTSYTLAGTTSSMLTFHPTLSGDYTVTVTMTLPDGTTRMCTFIVHIAGPGVRAEACWDTTGTSDIDLHMHKPGTMTDWFGPIGTPNADDCYYYNCKGSSFGPTFANWYPTTPLANCVGGPEGSSWSALGSCRNPRLDVDNISTPGIPENINVDNPPDGGSFRVMVHYYGGGGVTPVAHPLVNIYCGGHLLATYGQAPDLVPNFNTAGGYGSGSMWRVADILAHVDAGGVTTGCDITAIHPPGMVSGYYVTGSGGVPNSTAY